MKGYQYIDLIMRLSWGLNMKLKRLSKPLHLSEPHGANKPKSPSEPSRHRKPTDASES